MRRENPFCHHGYSESTTRSVRTQGIVVPKGAHEPQSLQVEVYGGPDHVLLKPLLNGLCGSDVQKLRNGSYAYAPYADGIILGHEVLAQTLEPHSVNGQRVSAGTLVVPIITRRVCGARGDTLAAPELPRCPCHPYITPGSSRWDGFASVVAYEHPDYLIAASDELYPYLVLSEPLAIVWKGLRRLLAASPPSAHPTAAVIGLGPIGLLAAGVLADQGWEIVGIDRVLPHHVRARLFGDFVGEKKAYLQFPEHRGRLGMFDVVVEAAGSRDSLEH